MQALCKPIPIKFYYRKAAQKWFLFFSPQYFKLLPQYFKRSPLYFKLSPLYF